MSVSNLRLARVSLPRTTPHFGAFARGKLGSRAGPGAPRCRVYFGGERGDTYTQTHSVRPRSGMHLVVLRVGSGSGGAGPAPRFLSPALPAPAAVKDGGQPPPQPTPQPDQRSVPPPAFSFSLKPQTGKALCPPPRGCSFPGQPGQALPWASPWAGVSLCWVGGLLSCSGDFGRAGSQLGAVAGLSPCPKAKQRGQKDLGGKGETEAQEEHPWLSTEGLGLMGAGWRITFLFNGIVCTGRRLLI